MATFLPNLVIGNALMGEAGQGEARIADPDLLALYREHGSCGVHEMAFPDRDHAASSLLAVG
jgi:hypothetical protein